MRPAPAHGRNGYMRYGCRCEVCKAANRDRAKVMRELLAARMAAGDPAVPHGTSGGYTNWSCRCEACRRANSAGHAEWEARSGRNRSVTP